MNYRRITPFRTLNLIIGVLAVLLLSGCKPTISFTALQTTIAEGTNTDLDWEVEFAKGSGDNVVEISPDIGVVEKEGIVEVSPDKTTTYTLKTRSFVFGFPMFINEELTIDVKEGDVWDFSTVTGGVDDWTFGHWNHFLDEVTFFNFKADKNQLIPAPINENGVLLSVKHVDPDDVSYPVYMYGKARKTGLEDDTNYKVTVNVDYAIAARTDNDECDTPAVSLSAYALLEEPIIEFDSDDDDRALLTNLDGTKVTLADDIVPFDEDICGDGVFEEKAESTGLSPIVVTTDSDGAVWLVISFEVSSPNLEVYIQRVTAFFDEE